MRHRQIKIAVCGHRRLSHLEHLEMGTQAAVEKIQTTCARGHYEVYSCLAEGADQLLARKLMEALAADLVVVLPLPEQEYLKDFQSIESIKEYRALKRLAQEVIPPGSKEARPLAYRAANETLAAHVDLLVAIWDGEPARGPGGTAEIVEMFRQAGRPLFWIHADQGPTAGTLTGERLERLV